MPTDTIRIPHLEPSSVRARSQLLARSDRKMKSDLVALRREAGLTQKDVADVLGVTQQAVQKLERYDSDPKLSTLSRYANVVGAIVEHSVTKDVGQSVWKAAGPRHRGSATLPRGPLFASSAAAHTPTQGWAASARISFDLAA